MVRRGMGRGPSLLAVASSSVPERHLIAVEPSTRPAMHAVMVEAVEAAGGTVVPIEQASALIFADPAAADAFPNIIGAGPGVEWIQLPYAGIETFQHHLDHDHTWTCGKGVYAPPVAEWIMAALLTAFRDIPRYVRASSWPEQDGKNLLGAKLTVLGGGGITESFMELIGPWGCDVTVVRRSTDPVPGAARTLTTDRLHEAVADADAVIVALALTDETRNIVDAETLAAMRSDAWLCNVGRGGHVVTDDLVTALREGVIAGAVLDVTDPEPLPDGHPLWELDNCVITPHVGNTPEMGLPLIADRVRVNVGRWIAGDELIGPVDVGVGY
ncbi:MAG TPA: hydroxyacid dehydrogenase [Acidimicrobiaceae bacterium]|nr:hydroxyacid dehydrogenase [Acidimicrobiaceae bacterium]